MKWIRKKGEQEVITIGAYIQFNQNIFIKLTKKDILAVVRSSHLFFINMFKYQQDIREMTKTKGQESK